jgi:hypothetical protein
MGGYRRKDNNRDKGIRKELGITDIKKYDKKCYKFAKNA